ncbi:MAG: hypothetical protein ABIH58_02910 [Patescibacteria group bacterium]
MKLYKYQISLRRHFYMPQAFLLLGSKRLMKTGKHFVLKGQTEQKSS